MLKSADCAGCDGHDGYDGNLVFLLNFLLKTSTYSFAILRDRPVIPVIAVIGL